MDIVHRWILLQNIHSYIHCIDAKMLFLINVCDFLGGHWNGICAVYDLPYICVLKNFDQSKPTPTVLKQCYRFIPKAKMDSLAQLGFSGVSLKIGGICPRRVHTSLLFHVLSQALSAYNLFLALLSFFFYPTPLTYLQSLSSCLLPPFLFFLSPLHAFYFHHIFCVCVFVFVLILVFVFACPLLHFFLSTNLSSTHSSNSVLLQSFFAKRFQQTFSISISQNKNDRGIYR